MEALKNLPGKDRRKGHAGREKRRTRVKICVHCCVSIPNLASEFPAR